MTKCFAKERLQTRTARKMYLMAPRWFAFFLFVQKRFLFVWPKSRTRFVATQRIIVFKSQTISQFHLIVSETSIGQFWGFCAKWNEMSKYRKSIRNQYAIIWLGLCWWCSKWINSNVMMLLLEPCLSLTFSRPQHDSPSSERRTDQRNARNRTESTSHLLFFALARRTNAFRARVCNGRWCASGLVKKVVSRLLKWFTELVRMISLHKRMHKFE